MWKNRGQTDIKSYIIRIYISPNLSWNLIYHSRTNRCKIAILVLSSNLRKVANFSELMMSSIWYQTMRPEEFGSWIEISIEFQKWIPYLQMHIIQSRKLFYLNTILLQVQINFTHCYSLEIDFHFGLNNEVCKLWNIVSYQKQNICVLLNFKVTSFSMINWTFWAETYPHNSPQRLRNLCSCIPGICRTNAVEKQDCLWLTKMKQEERIFWLNSHIYGRGMKTATTW